jgi:hypothetical protein
VKERLAVKAQMTSIRMRWLLLALCILALLRMLAGASFDVIAQEENHAETPHSNAYICSHYFSLLAEAMEDSQTPFQSDAYEAFLFDGVLKRNFVSSGIYLPLEMETTAGTAILHTLVAYGLTPEGKAREDLVALGVTWPDGSELFFLEEFAAGDLQAIRASMKRGAVFTATLTGFVNQYGVDWTSCPGSDFARQYGEPACMVGAALVAGNPPGVSSGFAGSFLFGWQLERSGEMIAFPICKYIED